MLNYSTGSMACIAEPKADCCVIDVSNSWLTSVEKKLQTAVTRRPCNGDLPPTIFKVPAHIRENDESAYDPKLVALGPYHRQKDKLQAMEQCKWGHLHKFIERNPCRRLVDYLKDMKTFEPFARGHYSELVGMSSDEFAEMLLLDGAFVVQILLVVSHQQEQYDPVTATECLLARVAYDMLLLENQIPFFVLQKLYSSAKASGPSVVPLALNFFRTFITTMKIPEGRYPENPIHHLLHLFYECILPLPDQPKPMKAHVHHRAVQGKSSVKAPESIPHAQQLHETGIKFRSKNHSSPLEVTFGDGAVEMSRLCIYDHTSPLFRNLIAFEQGYKMSGTHVTNFAIFMDCLVDKPADMAVLHREGVVMNGLGSQEEATDLFNRICKDVATNPEKSHLRELFVEVNRHCNSRWPRWRAKLARDYFSNPWAIVSLVAAVILLLLTFAQTFFAVLPYVVSKSE